MSLYKYKQKALKYIEFFILHKIDCFLIQTQNIMNIIQYKFCQFLRLCIYTFALVCLWQPNTLLAQVDDKYYDSDETIDTFAQIQNTTKAKEKKQRDYTGLILGADYQFGLGTSVFIDFSPYIGYKFYDRLTINIGIPYMYYYHMTYKESSHVVGLRGFIRLRPIVNGFGKNLFLHGEAEYLNCYLGYNRNTSSTPNYNQNRYIKENANGFNVGIGYVNNFSQGFSATLQVLYNLNYTSNHPVYASPIIFRIGFMYAF